MLSRFLRSAIVQPVAAANSILLFGNSANQPTMITVGNSLYDSSPDARDQFRYGPDGERYYRQSEYRDGNNVLRKVHTFSVAGYQRTIYYSGHAYKMSEQTTVDGAVLHTRNVRANNSVQSTLQYLHRDYQGSVHVITNSSGQVISQQRYRSFGERRSQSLIGGISTGESSGLVSNSHLIGQRGYTNHEMLDHTGFIHMNGRLYDPELGRFLSPDPIVQAPLNSQSWNRYSYVFNNPTSRVDPSGYTSDPVNPQDGDIRGQDWCQRNGGCEEMRVTPNGSRRDGVSRGTRDGFYNNLINASVTGFQYRFRHVTSARQLTRALANSDADIVSVNGQLVSESVVDVLQESAEAVLLTGHKVGGSGPIHLAIQYVDPITGQVKVISAGPVNGFLQSQNDENGYRIEDGIIGDHPTLNHTISVIQAPKGSNYKDYVALLSSLDANYNDQIPYTLFPSSPYQHNSNSYVLGLIHVSGGSINIPSSIFVGGLSPVPSVYFRGK